MSGGFGTSRRPAAPPETMEALLLIGIGFVGTLFWPVSTEAAAVVSGSRGMSPVWVGVLCGLGQGIVHILLYLGGEGLVLRWAWLGRAVTRTRERFGGHLERNFLVLAAVGAVLGIPPVIALSLMAYGLGVRMTHHLPIVFLGRMVRFTILAAGGGALLPFLPSGS